MYFERSCMERSAHCIANLLCGFREVLSGLEKVT